MTKEVSSRNTKNEIIQAYEELSAKVKDIEKQQPLQQKEQQEKKQQFEEEEYNYNLKQQRKKHIIKLNNEQ